MRARVSVCAGLSVLWLAIGCAEGFAHPTGVSAPLVSEGAGTGGGGASGEGGSGSDAAAGAAGMAAPPMFMGEACERGASEECACPEGGMGTRACKADTASPTGGAFGECTRCVLPEQPGGSGGAAAGAGGTIGAAGSGGDPGGGSAGSEPDPAGCDPAQCDEPAIGEVCCTEDDECGYRLLLSCNPQR